MGRKRRYTRPAEWEIEEFKRFLGPELVGRITEAELALLYREMHEWVKLLLDIYGQEDPEERFDSREGSGL